ncbi:hypothetical protein FLA4_05170 [Candidatus Rickettsia kotlanii]|nr:hypothetical protein FLA4_05170 [Candidatus Rickettsia kotlanii]BDU61350.1 hypothetical protein HM2_05180 [Candidatus Rickettsia kotlanii]
MEILSAIIPPMTAPNNMVAIIGNLWAKSGRKKVTTTAIAIPKIPMVLPKRACFCEDKNLSDRIKQTAATKYNNWIICRDIGECMFILLAI